MSRVTGKPRKRKSKSAEESPAMSPPTMSPPTALVPPSGQHYSHQSPSPPGTQQNSFQSFQPVPPFTSHMPHPNMPGPGYSNTYMSQMQGQYNPHIAYSYMQSQPSFTQMMNSGNHFMEMPHNGNTQNFPQHHISNGFPGQYPSTDGQQPNGFNPNMPIKQEKPDN